MLLSRASKKRAAHPRPLIIHHISAAPPCKLGFWRGFREDRRRSVLEYVSTGPQRKRSQNPRSQGVVSRCDESLAAEARVSSLGRGVRHASGCFHPDRSWRPLRDSQEDGRTGGPRGEK